MKQILTCLMALSLTSCVTLRELPIESSFSGITDHMQTPKCANLLIVHGLGGFSKGDPETLVAAIKNRLNFLEIDRPCARQIIKDNITYGYLVHTDLEDSSHNSLRIYQLYWHPSTARARSFLEDIDAQNTSHRVSLINTVKKDYVDSAFAEAILYVSNYTDEIQYPFKKAIEWIAQETCGEALSIVGFSLGGAMLIDALENLENQHLKENFVKQVADIYFLSNSSPLFELALLSKCPRTSLKWNWQEFPIGRFVHEKRKYDPDFHIIAVSDPNDALSFVVKDHYVPSRCGWENAYINQEVRNVKCSFCGLINPADAHTGYGKNPRVLDMVIYGTRNFYCFRK